MEGRRLDFDCKKRKGSKSMECIHFWVFQIHQHLLSNEFIYLFAVCIFAVPPEEIRAAEDKFDSSKTVCYNAMLTLSEGEVICLLKFSLIGEWISQKAISKLKMHQIYDGDVTWKPLGMFGILFYFASLVSLSLFTNWRP